MYEAVLLPHSVYHDLAHYVVETTLGLREGVWGLIASGHTLETYHLPDATRPFQISQEGYQAEFLATLVQSAVPTGEISTAYVDLLRQASAAAGLPFPALPPEDVLRRLIADAQALSQAWEALREGAEMRLAFGGFHHL